MAGWPKETERERKEAVNWMAKEFPRKSRWYRDAAIAWIATRREQAPAIVMQKLEENEEDQENQIVPSVPVGEKIKAYQREWEIEVARFGENETRRRRHQRKKIKTPPKKSLDALQYLIFEFALVAHLEKTVPWGTEETIGKALRNASTEFDAAVVSGDLEVHDDGTVSAKNVKAIWRATSGQGIGPPKQFHYEPDLIEWLVRRFRSGPRGSTTRVDLKKELFGRGESEAKTIGNGRFQDLLKLAFKLTRRSIDDDERLYKLTQSAQGISPEVATTQRTYLDSWEKAKGGNRPGKLRRSW